MFSLTWRIFVSFYDTTLAPSLIAVRSGKPRLAHRLLGIDEDDIVRVRKYLEEQIAETPWFSLQFEAVEHGIDWHATYIPSSACTESPSKTSGSSFTLPGPSTMFNQTIRVAKWRQLSDWLSTLFSGSSCTLCLLSGTLPILLGLLPFTKNVHCPTLRPSQPRHVQSRKLFYVRRWKERRANYAEFWLRCGPWASMRG